MFWEKQPTEVFYKNGKISQNSQENTYAGVSLLIKWQASACNFIKKETLSQVFFCGFCECFKNTFLQNTSGRLLLSKYSYSLYFYCTFNYNIVCFQDFVYLCLKGMIWILTKFLQRILSCFCLLKVQGWNSKIASE